MNAKKKIVWFLLMMFIFGTSIQTFAQAAKFVNVKQITTDNLRYANPVWSPDGKMFTYSKEDLSGLFLADVATLKKTKLTEDLGAGYQYKWSLDNKSIVYRATTSDNTDSKQYVAIVNIDGKKEIVSNNYDRIQTPYWNYSGTNKEVMLIEPNQKPLMTKRSAIKSTSTNSNNTQNLNKFPYFKDEKLYMVDTKGNFTLVNDAPSYNVVISPDGKKMAFNEIDNLVVMNIDGTSKKYLGYGHKPSWLNNTQLLYEVTTDDGEKYTSGDIYKININGKEKINITNTKDKIEMNVSCSSDGKKVLYVEHKSGKIYMATLQ